MKKKVVLSPSIANTTVNTDFASGAVGNISVRSIITSGTVGIICTVITIVSR